MIYNIVQCSKISKNNKFVCLLLSNELTHSRLLLAQFTKSCQKERLAAEIQTFHSFSTSVSLLKSAKVVEFGNKGASVMTMLGTIVLLYK